LRLWNRSQGHLLAFKAQRLKEGAMPLRLASLLAAMVIVPGLSLADEIVGGGAKLDETSRDSPYINEATKAIDPSAAPAQRAKDLRGEAPPAPRAHPVHRVLLRKSHGVIITRDVYVLPDNSSRDRAPLY
jgi:hypothetical protein